MPRAEQEEVFKQPTGGTGHLSRTGVLGWFSASPQLAGFKLDVNWIKLDCPFLQRWCWVLGIYVACRCFYMTTHYYQTVIGTINAQSRGGRCHVVLASNIAESSLTLPWPWDAVRAWSWDRGIGVEWFAAALLTELSSDILIDAGKISAERQGEEWTDACSVVNLGRYGMLGIEALPDRVASDHYNNPEPW